MSATPTHHRSRDMTEMLGRLRALGAPMDGEEPPQMGIPYTVNEEDGHAHVVYTNNDTYRGGWKDGKMNGFGTFRKNEVKKNQYQWQFYGLVQNNCAKEGQLTRPEDQDSGESTEGSGDVPLYEWDPFPPPGEREQATGGPIKATQQLQAMQERRAEQKRKNDAQANEEAKKYNAASDEMMNHGKGWVDRYGKK